MKADIEKLVSLMARLRSPGGCPWDREQTLASLVPFIIEEAYEVIAAIDEGPDEALKDELGDLLFQIIFACRIAEETGRFAMVDVIDHSYDKMVRRHPHVFGEAKAETSEDVLRHWAEIKKTEKRGKPSGGALAGVPESMPALLRAHKVSQKASKVGFDWKDISHVLEKLDEEVLEFHAAVSAQDAANVEEELGDILFTLVNVSRFMQVNPEDALRKTIGKFITRFHHVEASIIGQGRDIADASMDEMERLWQDAKKESKA
ncbi:MAG: nucleoside triphosphate pyrophosphohydrolase [Deltaproteobacteria bacterium]|nr:nucleoside triphosphate pyrophosphohydrolase [Deltaproteobacteria bacterium]